MAQLEGSLDFLLFLIFVLLLGNFIVFSIIKTSYDIKFLMEGVIGIVVQVMICMSWLSMNKNFDITILTLL